MKRILLQFLLFFIAYHTGQAQTAKVYRAGLLIGTYSSLAAASVAASDIGDSILLSAHTFKEYNIPLKGGQIWQGTLTSTDTSIIDGDYLGVCMQLYPTPPYHDIIIRDIVVEKGLRGIASGAGFSDTVKLKGSSMVRYCRKNGGVGSAALFDRAKLIYNTSDSFGGAAASIVAYDSAEICYNTSRIGGGIGYSTGGTFYSKSPGVRIHHNTATVGGGAFFLCEGKMDSCQITDNQAPIGAMLYTTCCGSIWARSCYVFNPSLSGKRQNEVHLPSGYFNMEGTWFGQSDTAGLFSLVPIHCTYLVGRPARANWQINRGKPITNKDTVFPIGAYFAYSDGAALPAKSLPWLRGSFVAGAGKMLTPNPTITAADSLYSAYRTYVYALKNDTSSKPIDFVCVVDADTFRSSPRVWGIDSLGLRIASATQTIDLKIYPNPVTEVLHIAHAPIGSQILLYDMAGKMLLNERSSAELTQISVANLAAGQYLLKIISPEGAIGSTKVQKE